MNHLQTKVYSYLITLRFYLRGDLNTFHKICDEIENEENGGSHTLTASGSSFATSSFDGYIPSTTTETTKPPNFINIPTPVHFSERIRFRLTIPVTLSLFSVSDILGYLIGNNGAQETAKNFKDFFLSADPSLSDNEIKTLVTIFRHGMAHNYFPKLALGISYHSSNPSEKLFFKDTNGNPTLNVNRLEELVIDRLEAIIQDESYYQGMETKYIALDQDYQQKVGALVTSLSIQ